MILVYYVYYLNKLILKAQANIQEMSMIKAFCDHTISRCKFLCIKYKYLHMEIFDILTLAFKCTQMSSLQLHLEK